MGDDRRHQVQAKADEVRLALGQRPRHVERRCALVGHRIRELRPNRRPEVVGHLAEERLDQRGETDAADAVERGGGAGGAGGAHAKLLPRRFHLRRVC